jgi:hypothetical protein
LRRLGEIDRRRLGLARDVVEVFPYQAQRVVAPEVADQAQHRVVRRVVSPEEAADVREARLVEIVHRADRGMLIGEVRVEQLVEVLVRQAVRLIVDAQATLFLDGLPLVVQLVLRDVERAHAIGFEEQRQLELVRRQHLEIERQVDAGRPVHRAAVGEHLVEVLAVADVLRALEHHVLEQVREARQSLALVARPDVVRDVQGDHGHAVILHELHAQTVVERRLGEIDAHPRGLGGKRAGARHGGSERQREPQACITDPVHTFLLRWH